MMLSPAATPGSMGADRALRAALWLVTGYLVLTMVPLALWSIEHGRPGPAGVHAIALMVAAAAALVRRETELARPTRGMRLIADWLPLALMLFVYLDIRWVIEAVGQPHGDGVAQSWERVWFVTDPSRTLALRFGGVIASEVLHGAYLSYYAIIVGPPLILYLRGQRDAFAGLVLSLTVVYVICSVFFVIFPVDGPRFVRGAAAAPPGPVRSFALWLLHVGSSRGTAFPSLHVGASVVAAICVLRFHRATGVALTVLTVGLTIATVYGGFHYGVDAVAGIAVGLLSAAIGLTTYRALGRARAT